MAYPAITGFKLRALPTATTTSSASVTTQITIPFRAKYLYSVLNYQAFATQGQAWQVNLAVNGSTVTADTVVSNPFLSSSTTSTAAVTGGFNSSTSNTATLFLNQGDVLATFGSSIVPYSITHIVQEF